MTTRRVGCCSPRPINGRRTARKYFGDGDECHMSFHFPLMPRMYMAIAQEDRFPISDIIRPDAADPRKSANGRFFLRNHDELTCSKWSPIKSAIYCGDTYGADRRARLNLGIRRRLAPLLEHDRQQHRADEHASSVDSGDAGHLLRRRARHGRQLPSRRSRRGAHADAMVATTATAASRAPARKI